MSSMAPIAERMLAALLVSNIDFQMHCIYTDKKFERALQCNIVLVQTLKYHNSTGFISSSDSIYDADDDPRKILPVSQLVDWSQLPQDGSIFNITGREQKIVSSWRNLCASFDSLSSTAQTV